MAISRDCVAGRLVKGAAELEGRTSDRRGEDSQANTGCEVGSDDRLCRFDAAIDPRTALCTPATVHATCVPHHRVKNVDDRFLDDQGVDRLAAAEERIEPSLRQVNTRADRTSEEGKNLLRAIGRRYVMTR